MNTSTLKNSAVTLTANDLGAPKITLRQRLARHPQLFTLALIIAVCLVVSAINPEFFQLAMVFDIVRASTVLGLFALGVMIVLAAGGIDVSFAAIAALTMYGITKLVMTQFPETSMAVILVAGAVGGTLLGVLNGLLVDWLKAPSLIVTIGTQYLYRGILLTFVGTVFFMNVPHSMDAFGKLAVWRHDTATGVHAVLPYAIGGSLPIAERLGYKLRTVHLFVFGYAGFLAGLAGIVHVSSTRLANPFDLVGMELDVIAAVILGGARITGGSGSVSGTLLGVLLVTLINNVLILAGVPSTWQKVIVGTFIVLAGAVFASKRSS